MRTFPRFEKSLLIKEYAEVGLPSPVQGNLELHHMVEKRKQAGDIINLSIMTDQTPPPVVRIAAAEQALKGGYIKNVLSVRQKICDFYEKDRGARFNPETEIFLTTGSQLGLDSAFKLLIDPGDEVLMGEPEYATYEPMIHFYGGKASFCPLVLKGTTWTFDLAAFEKAVTPRTKLVVMSHPNNPVGYVYRREELQAIAKIVKAQGCWLLSDEIWSTLILDERLQFVSMGVFEEIRDRLVVLFSASKTFGMSGYRVGAIMGPADFIEAIDQVARFSIQSAPTIGQVAFARALDFAETGPWLEGRKAELRRRIRETVQQMNSLRKLRCADPESGVFLFPFIGDYGLGSLKFAMRLLTEKGVYTLPGYFYGRHCDGCLRISLSVSESDYRQGIGRLLEFVKTLEG
ncbi:MAG TPA: pyridoxal phosphate-dependent aminotransferase [Candidatus Methylomirabilis sp.]|nr:pyridoxal phosphate-dependent aminotransferase [Candidatus Methylomirabilis sp.]